MPATKDRPIAIFYEHPDWFRPLFAELDRRGTPYVKIHAAEHRFDPAGEPHYSLVFNRMSPSAWLRGRRWGAWYWWTVTCTRIATRPTRTSCRETWASPRWRCKVDG